MGTDYARLFNKALADEIRVMPPNRMAQLMELKASERPLPGDDILRPILDTVRTMSGSGHRALEALIAESGDPDRVQEDLITQLASEPGQISRLSRLLGRGLRGRAAR